MKDLDIPEEYAPAPYSVGYHRGGYYVTCNGHPHTSGTRALLADAPAMAEEIKRLREERVRLAAEIELLKEDLSRQLDYTANLSKQVSSPTSREDRAFQCLQGLLANQKWGTECNAEICAGYALEQADAMLAALAKPQGAQETEKAELPAGCEPFDIERFRVEGGMSADGGKAQYIGLRGEFVFAKVDDFEFLFHEDGKAVGCEKKHLQLYCIAKPVTRRPFDLAAALRGEKVVTRDGKHITRIKKRRGIGAYSVMFQIENEIGFSVYGSEPLWRTCKHDGAYLLNGNHDLDLFMEGGV